MYNSDTNNIPQRPGIGYRFPWTGSTLHYLDPLLHSSSIRLYIPTSIYLYLSIYSIHPSIQLSICASMHFRRSITSTGLLRSDDNWPRASQILFLCGFSRGPHGDFRGNTPEKSSPRPYAYAFERTPRMSGRKMRVAAQEWKL